MAEELGYGTHEVADGVEAVEAAIRLMPAAVVLDRVLPRLRAEEVAERLRDHEATAASPLFALANRVRPGAAGRALPRLRPQAARPALWRRPWSGSPAPPWHAGL